MDFDLNPDSEQLRRELAARVRSHGLWRGDADGVIGLAAWRDLVQFGLFEIESAVDRSVALMEVATRGLAGPVLETYLALGAGLPDASRALEGGRLVTSVPPGPAGPCLVAWGSVADLVLDQSSGATLCAGSLPPAGLAFPLPLGWWVRTGDVDDDPCRRDRWILGSALLVGLSRGALELTSSHVVDRHQFGRPLAAFQAVQFPLAEARAFVEAAELAVLDAAWRADAGDALDEVGAALAWLWTARAARRAADACHQAFGALGFCHEAGLVGLTYAAAWLRLSIGRRSALDLVRKRRGVPSSDPGCRVLDGFGRHAAVPHTSAATT